MLTGPENLRPEEEEVKVRSQPANGGRRAPANNRSSSAAALKLAARITRGAVVSSPLPFVLSFFSQPVPACKREIRTHTHTLHTRARTHAHAHAYACGPGSGFSSTEASWGQSELHLDDVIRATEQKEEKDRADFEAWIVKKLSIDDEKGGEGEKNSDKFGRKRKQLQSLIKFVKSREKLNRLTEELEALQEKDVSQGKKS